ncbi:MAG TPA: ATP-binding protein [Candidatus Limnocylindrales bacterium]|nr:ATP-binding protein [Candidatus Limnocylindrales bacterium]
MDLRLDDVARRRLTLLLAAAIIVVGWTTLLLGKFDSGVRLTWNGERVVVSDVMPGSIAAQYGLQPGMVVTQLQHVTLIEMPQFVEPDPGMPSPDPFTGETPDYVPTVEPRTPTRVPLNDDLLTGLLSRPPTQITAVQPWDLDQPGPYESPVNQIELYDDGMDGIRLTMPSFAMGVILLVVVGWWLASGRGGPSVRGLAAPLALATAAPFVVRPMVASYSLSLVVLSGLLLTAAMVPLALALLERIPDIHDRRLVGYGTIGCIGAAATLGVIAAFNSPWAAEGLARWAIVAAIPLLPGLAAAGPIDRRSPEDGAPAPASRRLLESAEYAVIGATPAVALASDRPPYLPYPLLFWFALILLAGRFTIRPLARIATRATLQRDLVVAATEAERARVAADIHDDALQELTLLVHRLDAAGDAEGADIARTVSDRLRAICGDLRLPILDDLGVGPALDWLVVRIERLAGGEVRLERTDGTRPPAAVELAFFRVAQEALSNAVKHGKPPILVRYATTPGGASMSIDDAGPGIDPDATTTTDRTGHFGLLNMQQRAEAIGAILDVRRWPSGGTHVALDWRAG